MTMFSTKNLIHYAVALSLIVIASYVGNKFKDSFANTDQDEYELIRKYLLNDSPLYGYDKPKLWVHSKYEYNARKWQSFMTRSSTDLNQPYVLLTIKTIINHCGEDFNVCLIDDESFSRLIPGWDINVSRLAEPKKSQFRELGMAELVYLYGGMVVPNSFVCLRNLMPLYLQGIGSKENMPFVAENISRHVDIARETNRLIFTSDSFFMGAPKRCPLIREYVDYLKRQNKNPHSFEQREFVCDSSYWLNVAVKKGNMNQIYGEQIGVKSTKGKPILVEDLMEEAPLDICASNLFGIYIPEHELLRRTKYQWFPVISAEELLSTNLIIVKYLATAIVEGVRTNAKKKTVIESSDQNMISI